MPNAWRKFPSLGKVKNTNSNEMTEKRLISVDFKIGTAPAMP
jgi:hypothetical protein